MDTAKIGCLIEERSIPEPMSGCWLWFQSQIGTGYGDFRLDHKHYLAHRASYEVYKGEIPKGMHVLHKCDTRCCVNPDHLFLGTNLDNIQDSVKKGRRKGVTRNRPNGLTYKPQSPESRTAQMKLSPEDCETIIADEGFSQRELAELFGVSKGTIQRIISGDKIWRRL